MITLDPFGRDLLTPASLQRFIYTEITNGPLGKNVLTSTPSST
jgi:hypothetical protein